MRLFWALTLSIIISIGLFFGMHVMTNSHNKTLKESNELRPLVYLREKKDSKVERKKRIKPKPKIKKIQKKVKLQKKYSTQPQKNVKIVPIKIQQKIEISKIASLVGAQVLLDANSLSPLKRVSPRYPRRAKLKKKEGFVKLVFDIGKDGYVYNVKILESTPVGIFEQSSINAIKRWKFNTSQFSKSASITFNFRLAK